MQSCLKDITPTTSTQLPLLEARSRKPKLIWLDTGLVNYVSDIRHEVFSTSDILDVWRGSEAEVDFVVTYKGMLIPIEVKSGHNAKLKSLHIFMDKAPHNIAVRVWSNPLSIDEVSTVNGKMFKLINLPFYYVSVLDKVLDKYV